MKQRWHKRKKENPFFLRKCVVEIMSFCGCPGPVNIATSKEETLITKFEW